MLKKSNFIIITKESISWKNKKKLRNLLNSLLLTFEVKENNARKTVMKSISINPNWNKPDAIKKVGIIVNTANFFKLTKTIIYFTKFLNMVIKYFSDNSYFINLICK